MYNTCVACTLAYFAPAPNTSFMLTCDDGIVGGGVASAGVTIRAYYRRSDCELHNASVRCTVEPHFNAPAYTWIWLFSHSNKAEDRTRM